MDPDGCAYQAGIRIVYPVKPKKTCPVVPHRYLYIPQWIFDLLHLGALYINCVIEITWPQT